MTAQLTYAPYVERPRLSIMSRDGAPLEENATTERYLRLAWSPVGDQFLLQRLVSVPGGGGSANAIFLGAHDGTELTQVTPEWTQAPDWSSTGEIAFGQFNDPVCLPNCEDIFVTRLGGTPRRLTYRGGSTPSWSPHGTKLAFLRAGDIYIIGRDGRGLRRLTRRGGYSPAWSPDGKWIAFIRDGDIYVVRTNGRGRRRLVDGPGLDLEGPSVTSIDWQPLPRP
jgi:dipeptidyl aminopeptidase/acylaminoacyl peptidase